MRQVELKPTAGRSQRLGNRRRSGDLPTLCSTRCRWLMRSPANSRRLPAATGGPVEALARSDRANAGYDARRSAHQWFRRHLPQRWPHQRSTLRHTERRFLWQRQVNADVARGDENRPIHLARLAERPRCGREEVVRGNDVRQGADRQTKIKAVTMPSPFSASLDHPTSPYRGPKLSAAIERGKKVFESKGRCAIGLHHKGEEYHRDQRAIMT